MRPKMIPVSCLDGGSLTDVNNTSVESAEQDQMAHLCRLISLTFVKINPRPQTAGKVLILHTGTSLFMLYHGGIDLCTLR